MILKELTEQEALYVIMENAHEENLDLTPFQNPLFSILRRMYHKGLGLTCWQGSSEFARFAGRGQQTLQPVQPSVPTPTPTFAPQMPSQPGPQPIRQAPAPAPSGRVVPPHPVPRQAPIYPIPSTGMQPTAPTAPPIFEPEMPSRG